MMVVGKITKICNLINTTPEFMGEGDMMFDELVDDLQCDIKEMKEKNIDLCKLTIDVNDSTDKIIKSIENNYLESEDFKVEMLKNKDKLLSIVLSTNDGSKFSAYYFH